ncbi:MAG TPA: DUF6249 domain-containing protein [Casimicrobiaceae bacterium]|nr:DUF6249 domain-containing protein [Casimicrobiaceae bacterium]
MQDSRSCAPARRFRRLVLGAAFATGLVVALAPHLATVRAADLPAASILAQADATPRSAPDGRRAEAGSADDDASNGHVTADDHGIVIEKGDKRIRIGGLGRDREYDSFQQFVQDAPWLAGLVFFFVLLVFLIPLLIIVLLIWYKIRKTRMANETMLKLAEHGVVPQAAAMDAVASGTAASVAAAAAAPPSPNSPAYEQARYLHRRTVWSDLRKGIILGAVGLGLTFYSMLDNGTPNSIGLILLFVGLGYCLLWFFEDRSSAPSRDTPGTRPPGSV